MADETSDNTGANRATVAQTLAEVRGLRDFIDARFTDTQRQLDPLAGMPAQVATLRAELRALDAREVEADNDMSDRVSRLETGRVAQTARHWTLVAALFSAGCFGAVDLILQVAGGR